MKNFSSGFLQRRTALLGMMLFFCLFTVVADAQEKIIPNELVKVALGSAEIEGIMANDPNGILYYNYLTESGWFLMDLPEEKAASIESYPYLHKVNRATKEILPEMLDVKDLSSFNLLLYQYRISDSRNYYRVQNSNQVLVIKSSKEITEGINSIIK